MSGTNQAAFRGATIAFQEYSRDPSPAYNHQPSSTAAAAAFASTVNRHADSNHRQMEADPGPEVGSVKDKIGRFTANSLAPQQDSRGRVSASSLAPPTPQQIAARLAASRSPERPARSGDSTPSTAASLGAIRSASRMQPHTPEKQELRSPAPVRPIYGRKSPLDKMLQGDSPSSEELSGPTRSPSQRPRVPARRNDHPPSPPPSIRSRRSPAPSDESKPKPPPRASDVHLSRGSLRKPTTSLRSTPSLASVSGLSHNTSSSSLVDESSGMSEEALSNAIVASTLASSRASPAAKIPPPPPPQRRRARSILHLAHTPTSDLSRTPSPPKGMPQTLRGMPKPDSDPHQRHKMRLIRKHPHKHHEGDRKRWRSEITEQERKRYEGVWASNKGLLIPPSMGDHPDMVLNLVVREVWGRSRLPAAALEQVWELVDRQRIGLLGREEFVVGMWLIDQQLKGHKLPVQVPDSVWDSVRHITGLRLPTA
ncbi:hypothetical protein N7474_000522 [Penicillium riverlandense]|uniref:uncharacterized protein n=1 Tax=Penicillium riverlandense TaxID=1903569 RepID=UPI002548F1FE|nr:uncharacterized protein N7474_000522 [Penicillium riverlandense]KAJ5832211.1 hypothetical protein N7474_000522 [Penicillium riverlandense]